MGEQEHEEQSIPSRPADEDAPVRDVTSQIKGLSRSTPREPEEVRMFLESRRRAIVRNPLLDEPEKQDALAELDRIIRRHSLAEDLEPPPPGGQGYGVNYAEDFRTGFGTGSAIEFRFICPTRPGGNVSNFLYLTSTNRTSLGVEALILYNGQDELGFRVFDWARDPKWQVSLTYKSLGKYLFSTNHNNKDYQTLHMMNLTYQLNATTWTNRVLFLNRLGQTITPDSFPIWDLIYRYDYATTGDVQRASSPGSGGWWGPIVETFQDDYRQTNPLGFLNISLASRAGGDLGEWWPLDRQHLSPSQSSTRQDNVGFRLVEFLPNYLFIVEGQ